MIFTVVSLDVWKEMGALKMPSDDYKSQKKVFEILLKADKQLWDAVLEVKDGDAQQLSEFAKPLMKLRGEIHTEFLRPIYKKYPELADDAWPGWKDENTD